MSSSSKKIPCGGADNAMEGCQEIFPRSTTVLCQKCKKLSVPNLSNDEVEAIKKYISCESCGLCGINISNPCGTCRRKDHEEKGEFDASKEAAASERHQRAQRSFGAQGQFKVPALPASQTIGSTTPLAELEASKSSALKGNWTVVYQVRRSSTKGSIDKSLGSGTLTFPSDITLPSILDGLVEQINVQWTKIEGHTLDLKPAECELRFFGNYVLDIAAATLTIKDFYTVYINRPDKSLLDPADKRIKLPKGTFVCFEVYINDQQYKKRLADATYDGDDDDTELFGGAKKRSSNKVSEIQSKRRRSGTYASTGPLQSTYALDVPASAPVVLKTRTVVFTLITCIIDPNDGKPRLSESSITETGHISKNTLILAAADKGISKDVYNLSIEGRKIQYVAKCFQSKIARQSAGETQIDFNQRLLISELIRIKRLESFREKFFEIVNDSAVECADFLVSDAFIAVISPFESDVAGSDKALADSYLVEPLRARTTVTKFSGTFGASTKQDKMSSAISAFAHFIAADTACKLVFADLQGSEDYKPGQRPKMVLFDPMSHSPLKVTGLGDFGIQGIEDFVESHTCSPVCKHLSLPSLDVLRESLNKLKEEAEASGERGDTVSENYTIVKEGDGETDMELESVI